MLIIGVDPSKTRLAAVIWDGASTFHVAKRSMPEDLAFCCVIGRRWMRDLVLKYGPLDDVWVFVEAPVLGRGGARSTIVQAQVNGAVLAGAYVTGAKVVLVNNQTAKRRVVGKGNATKSDINRYIRRTWPKLWAAARGNQDLCDSAMIALYGNYIVRTRSKVRPRCRR